MKNKIQRKKVLHILKMNEGKIVVPMYFRYVQTHEYSKEEKNEEIYYTIQLIKKKIHK